jgi:1,4-alpha-glucan branching enzyme
LSEYLAEHPECPESEPEFSSWAEGGYAEAWLDGRNDWVHRHTRKAAERMRELTIRFPNESGLRERILNQAAREVLLAIPRTGRFFCEAEEARISPGGRSASRYTISITSMRCYPPIPSRPNG